MNSTRARCKPCGLALPTHYKIINMPKLDAADVVWLVFERELPKLKPQIEAILKELA